eukprot:TRINITY_DN1113_c0_g1_i2.p1 TRINITY_DN1113_c0_g1~~TRINITY_DN1113_c0_g1_i2.p1  ORF type:complete len:177 (-),score=13.75 TRINITY_DN1113_c0_g1_i2:916-1446(-)
MREAINPGNNLYVTGLSTRVSEKDLEEHFSKEGKVIECRLVVDPRTRESRGFGFVTMDTSEDAERSIKYLNRSILEGRVITVEKVLSLVVHYLLLLWVAHCSGVLCTMTTVPTQLCIRHVLIVLVHLVGPRYSEGHGLNIQAPRQLSSLSISTCSVQLNQLEQSNLTNLSIVQLAA